MLSRKILFLTHHPTSNWIVKSKLANKKTNYHLNTAKIDVSNHLQSLIWSKAAGVILTSATLTSLGSFDRMNQQLGLEAKENRYLRLASPFNHESVDFIVANIKASPAEVFEHTQELARELKKRINQKSSNPSIICLQQSNANGSRPSRENNRV